MSWEIEVNVLNLKKKIIKTIIGNVNSSYDKEDTIDISIPVVEGEEYQQFQFSQSTGKCLTSELYKLADKEIKMLNDPKLWEIKKYKK